MFVARYHEPEVVGGKVFQHRQAKYPTSPFVHAAA
jgi:hypothetical protein